VAEAVSSGVPFDLNLGQIISARQSFKAPGEYTSLLYVIVSN
jgi:hypothetical protein